MRIEQRQCLLGILPGKLFLSIGQVSICKIVMGVGRIGISQQVELKDLVCRICLRTNIVSECFDECRRRLSRPSVEYQTRKTWGSRQNQQAPCLCGMMAGKFFLFHNKSKNFKFGMGGGKIWEKLGV